MPNLVTAYARATLIAKLAALALLSGLLLGEVYAKAALLLGSSWQMTALVVHSVVALALVFTTQPRWSASWQTHPAWWAYLPALAVLVGSLALAACVAPPPEATASPMASAPACWPLALAAWQHILWVPLVEELVFRRGLAVAFCRIGGSPNLAIYFSSLTFSWLHSIPSWDRLSSGETALYAGPLLLAYVCGWLYWKTAKLGPAIALHAACNASVLIWQCSDRPLPAWLSAFYL